MSEVERYWIDPSRLVQEGWHQDDTCVVKDWAYDRVVAERDALQQRLAAADERADVLGGLLFSLPEGLKDLSGSENTAGVYACIDYIEQSIAGLQLVSALKPALATNDEHICSGCGSKGWTANCKECVPY